MCSTPGRSVKSYSSHRPSVSTSYHKSYSHMMRDASERYQQQQKLAEKRAKLMQNENLEVAGDSTDDLEYEALSEDKSLAPIKTEACFFMRIFRKLSRFIERKPSSIYHEYR
ncbi:MAG: hypothetical protein KAI22_12045 [Gammaproteobacteria bacterium]|nr:hypothetical protein [Gammaproteobacteria bacterium]